MPVHNSDIARTLRRVADLLEIEEENPFRVRAYRNAASTVESLGREVSEMLANEQDLSGLEGIGEDLAGQIQNYVETGSLSRLKELEKKTEPGLIDVMKIPGVGAKMAKKIHDKLGVKNLDDLEKAVEKKKIRDLEGFGRKTEEKISEELDRVRSEGKRHLLHEVVPVAESLKEYLKSLKGVGQVEITGSYRRRKETVGDLDVLVTARDRKKVMEHFVNYEDVMKVVSRGETRSSVLLQSGLQVDARVVSAQSFGAAMLYFTGSQKHSVALRKLAKRKDIKINEYGAHKGDKRIAAKTENAIYRKVGLEYIEPELREGRGEIEASKEDKLPELIQQEDIRGDLQSHTKYSDGKSTVEEMAQAAKEQGYDYFAITDHSQNVSVTQGMDAKKLRKQIKEIEKVKEKFKRFHLLKSVEVDILEDGKLDLPDDVLKELDLRICSVHSHFKLSREKQTERIIRAMDNPYFNILAHPTGRMIGKRGAFEVDLEKIMDAALERGCFLELNASPDRLDLNDVYCKMAKEKGVKLAISTDAHQPGNLQFMKYGIGQARRGWLEKKDVLNTRTWKQLQKLLKRD